MQASCYSRKPALQLRQQRGAVVLAVPVAVTNLSTNQTVRFEKAKVVIGFGPSCDVKAERGPDVASEHVLLEQGRQGVFCKALVGEEVFDSSCCYLNGTEMRPKVGYLLGTGSVITIGSPSGASFRVDFKESSGSNPMLEMMMQGMASGSAEVTKALKL